MSRFSDRIGKTKPRDIIQRENIDTETLNQLWNLASSLYLVDSEREIGGRMSNNFSIFLATLWDRFFKKPIDTLAGNWKTNYDNIKHYFFNARWFEVYNFLEHLAGIDPFGKRNKFITQCNDILKENLCAYRFIDKILTPITSEEEIEEIENVLSNKNTIQPVDTHLKNALVLMAKKPQADYRNSIKESISAVEAMCGIITKNPKSPLGQTLKEIQKSGIVKIHPALAGAFEKLYGWTSDDGGIRHALMDEPDLDLEDARYMLVTCSSFINYLLLKADKAKISLK